MKVIATIQSTIPATAPEWLPHPPVDMPWCNSEGEGEVIAAIASLIASRNDDKQYTRLLGIRVEF